MNELPFIYQIQNNSSTTYELQRQGLQFLQSLESKRVIVIFSVSTNINPYPFAASFMNESDPESTNVHYNYPLSSITISKQIQLIQPDYILVYMNYCHKGTNFNDNFLLIFGYLIASMMLFHNQGELGNKSDVVQLLSGLQAVVESNLNQKSMRNQRGGMQQRRKESINNNSDSIPDFYCLIHNQRPSISKTNTFLNIFKDFSTSTIKQLQKSIQALGSLFNNRKTQHLPQHQSSKDFSKAVKQIRTDILYFISCKRFLGYEVTGSMIKHLACQMIILRNEGAKQINFESVNKKLLVDMIETQKQFGFTLYLKKLGYRIRARDMPMQKQQILTLHQKSIRQTFQQFVSIISGIDVTDFVLVWKQILQKCGEHLDHVLKQNQNATKQLNDILFGQLSDAEIDYKKQDMINIIFLFASKSIGGNSKDLLCALVQNMIGKQEQSLKSVINDKQKYISELQTKILVQSVHSEHLQKENQEFRMRINQCYCQKQLTSYISQSREAQDDLKQELIKKKTKYKSMIIKLQKQIQGLEFKLGEQILKRQTAEADLEDVSDKYDHYISKDRGKGKLSLISQLSKNLKDQIQAFQRISNKVHKMEGVYKYAKDIATQNKKLSEEIQKKTNIARQLQTQEKKLYSNITTYDQTIKELQWNADCYKNNIRELQMENGGYKVEIADMDAKIQVYGKCLKLIKGYIKTKKQEPLFNFIKLTQYEDIQAQISELLK